MMRVPQLSLGPRLALLATMVTWFSLGSAVTAGFLGGSWWVIVPTLIVPHLTCLFTTMIEDMHMCVFWMEEFIRNERKRNGLR